MLQRGTARAQPPRSFATPFSFVRDQNGVTALVPATMREGEVTDLLNDLQRPMTSPVSHLGAVCFAIAGFTFWVLCDSVIKLAGRSRLPNFEIVAFLGAFMAMFMVMYASSRGSWKDVWPRRPKRLVVRALLDVGNNLCVVIALRHLSLTLFYILIFTSPLLVTLLGRVFLSERLDWRKLAALLTGFAGVVIAVYPSGRSEHRDWTGFIACAICASCFSAAIVWSRVIAQTERAESMTFFSGLIGACVGATGMLGYAVPVDGRLLAALVVMGLFCALGCIFIFIALRYTTAATVSQYHYTQLVSGSIVAWLLFREKPTMWMLAGALLIIASGLYIAMHPPVVTQEVEVLVDIPAGDALRRSAATDLK
jgi:drug/metabolite transporter (DMT)-like permease